MNSNDFLSPFRTLRDKWLPNLGVKLITIGEPKVEKKIYKLSADFKIEVDITSNVMKGKCNNNCSNQNEVNQKIKTISLNGCSGDSKVLNNCLQDRLNKSNLLELNKIKKISLREYNYSCLITCTKCSGSGDVKCGGCGGFGCISETYQERVPDELTLVNGYEYRIPKYETRNRTVSHNSCGGSGRQLCGTCDGDGENTFKKTAAFYSYSENRNIDWFTFSMIPWANTFIKNKNKETLDVNKAVDWSYSEQTVQEKGQSGIYHVCLPGVLTASQCEVEAISQYAEPTRGLCKMLGALPYDTNFVFDSHIRWDAYKDGTIEFNGESLTPILSNPLVEACVRDLNGQGVPSGDLSYLNIIRKETSQSLQWLMRKLYLIHEANREKLSVFKLLLNSIFAGLALFAMITCAKVIDSGFDTNNFGLFPISMNLIEVVQTIIQRSINQVSGYIDVRMLMYLTVAFIPSMLLMKLFSSNKALTVSRMLKWYVFGGLFIVAFFLQFENNYIADGYAKATTPIFDFILLSFLGGVLWSRKGSFDRQKKDAKDYNSPRLMQLLGYEEKIIVDSATSDDITLGQALGGVLFMALLAWGLSEMPTNNLFLQIVAGLIFIFMILLNIGVILGLTSFQHKKTLMFYSFILPIYPLFLIADNFVLHYEWWHYFIIFIVVGVCAGILGAMFENKIFVRAVQSVITIMLTFSSPFLYSAIF